MKAADVMTRQVVSASPDTPIMEAARLMLEKRISGLPVIDSEGKLVGIVTEGDLLRRVETGTERRRAHWLEVLISPGFLAGEYVQSHGRKASEIMTARPQTITEETPLEEIVSLMEKKHIKRLPVLRGGEVIGIVSRADIVHALLTLAPETQSSIPADANIRERIQAELDRQPWAPRNLGIIVRDGMVELWGTVFDNRERRALLVAAENVPGVKEIHDHLVWTEPMVTMIFDRPNQEREESDISA